MLSKPFTTSPTSSPTSHTTINLRARTASQPTTMAMATTMGRFPKKLESRQDSAHSQRATGGTANRVRQVSPHQTPYCPDPFHFLYSVLRRQPPSSFSPLSSRQESDTTTYKLNARARVCPWNIALLSSVSCEPYRTFGRVITGTLRITSAIRTMMLNRMPRPHF